MKSYRRSSVLFMGSGYICPPLSPYIIPMLYTTFSLFFLSFSLFVLYFTTLLLDKLFKDMRERKSNARKVGGTRRKSKEKKNSKFYRAVRRSSRFFYTTLLMVVVLPAEGRRIVFLVVDDNSSCSECGECVSTWPSGRPLPQSRK